MNSSSPCVPGATRIVVGGRGGFGTPAAGRDDERPTQNVMCTDAALRFASPWKTASMLLPSGSSTKAA